MSSEVDDGEDNDPMAEKSVRDGFEENDSYKVGYKKPPKKTQFKKGESGNPKGRPPNKPQGQIKIATLFDEDITVLQNGKPVKVTEFEARILGLRSKALKDKNITSAIKLMKECEKYGLFAPPSSEGHAQNGLVIVPKSWVISDFVHMFNINGPPPWKGNGHCGLTDDEIERRGYEE